jgi:2-haloacid dehalogenase
MTSTDFTDIAACLFDAYGTLFDVHSAVAQEAGALGDKADPVSQLWRRKQLEYTWLRSLMRVHADFYQVTADALDHALAAHGIDDRELRERLLELYLTLDAYPEVPDTLDRIRAKGIGTGILSNGEPRMLTAATDSANLRARLDDVISVEPVGIYKPDQQVYELGVERMGVAAERIAFVSANAWDACGAAHFGFQVIWLNRFAAMPEHLPGTPKATATTLDQVADLLGC